MFNISHFLEKFKMIGVQNVTSRKIVIKNIEKILGVSLEEKAVVLRNNIVHIKAHPLIKTELYLKKAEILAELKRDPYTARVVDLL